MQRQLRGLLLAVALLVPAGAAAQVVDGVLLDGRSGAPIPRATVALVDSAGRTVASQVTRADGRFRLRGAAGLYRVRAESGGAALAEGMVVLGERGTVQIDLRTAGRLAAAASGDSAVALEPLEATAAVQRRRLVNAGFYDRQRFNSGVFLTGEQFAARGGARVMDMLGGLRGIFYRHEPAGLFNGSSYVIYQHRFGGRCRVSLWVDGLQRDPDVLDDLKPEDVEAVEVYNGSEVPPRFLPVRRASSGSACGAVVLWLKAPKR